MRKKRLGVVIGRFQIAELHAGHRHIIDESIRKSDKTLVLVGMRDGQPTNRDPLDFETRKEMIIGSYPNVYVTKVHDHFSDEEWSRRLDRMVESLFPDHDVTLFGSRDSFIPRYSGTYRCEEVSEIEGISATHVREAGIAVVDDPMFRHGIIHVATKQRYPTSYQVVDVAVTHTTKDEVLLGRKHGEHGWRFIGGFVEPSDETLERAAKREAQEELGGIELDDFVYAGSTQVFDHRYHGSSDAVMSAFFVAKYIFGMVYPTDDIDEVKWFRFDKVEKNLIESHKRLGEIFIKHITKK